MKLLIKIFRTITFFLLLQTSFSYSQEAIDGEVFLDPPPYNGTCVIGGITVTCVGGSAQPYWTPVPANLNFCTPSASYSGNGASTSYGNIVFTFSVPITSVRIPFSCVDNYITTGGYPSPDVCRILVNSAGIVSYSNHCGVITNSTYPTYLVCSLPTAQPGATNRGDVAVTVSSTVPFTTLTVQNLGSSAWHSNPCNLRDIVTCRSGNNAPNLSTNYINNICPNQTSNLTSITASNQPLSTLLTWHTSLPITGSSLVANPSSVAAGTYYAAFYDSLNNCYSPASTVVSTEIIACQSDLKITKAISSNTPAVGSNVTFTLTATNLGTSPATGVYVTDNIPSGYTFVSATPSTGNWSAPSWNIGNLAVNAPATLTIVATVNGSGNFTNTASITGLQFDPATRNNTNSVAPQVIYAAPDNFISNVINPCVGGVTASVLSNDMISGFLANSTQVTTSLINSGGLVGVTINSNGVITIPAGNAAGIYNITYQICQTASGYTSNCTQGIATVKLGHIPLIAVNDNFIGSPINTLTGGQTTTVLLNDTLNGNPASSSNVTVIYNNDVSPNILPTPTINAVGVIDIPQGTTNGLYTLTYTILENGCLMNTSTATVTILVNEQVIITPQIVPGTRANEVVKDMDIQVDTFGNQKIIISGDFTSYNYINTNNIARLNSDLTLDQSFVTLGPTPSMFTANDLKVIKNSGANYNKILLVGSFTGFNGGSNGTGIIRLMPDGSVDNSFNADYTLPDRGVSGNNSTIYSCYIYPDGNGDNTGKILIGGMFTAYNGQPRYRIARLFEDGSIDYDFNPNIFNPDEFYNGPGFTSAPTTIVVDQSTQKIIVGGHFKHFNGVLVNCIARLNNNGTIDPTFTYGGNNTSYKGITKNTGSPSNFNVYVSDLILESSGKIIIGGQFHKYNNTTRNNIARLTSVGALDTTFGGNTGFNNTTLNPQTGTYGLVRDLDLDAINNKLYVSGDFTSFNSSACDEVVRLYAGTTSPGFRDFGFALDGGGTNGTVWNMKRQNDGKIIIGGRFTMYKNLSALNITRIFPSSASSEAKNGTVYYMSEIDAINSAMNDIVIYPNPSNGKIYLKADEFQNQKMDVILYSVLGQKVFEKREFEINDVELDLSFLDKGTYFVKFVNEEKTLTKTLVVK